MPENAVSAAPATAASPTTASPTAVDFWFDPSCPWAWMTSRWLDEVSTLRSIEPRWHVMSLAVLNENRPDLPEAYVKFLPRALRYTRLISAVTAIHGQAQAKPLYDALGSRIHVGARTDADAIMAESLTEVGLDVALAGYADSAEFDPQMRASHFDGIGRVGQDVGTPVIAIGDYAFFGPVISPAPKGEQAAKLWDGVVALAGFDGFFELKRSRTREPIFG